MADEIKPLTLEFDLGANGGKLSFSSPDELRQWATKEYTTWNWLRSNNDPSNFLLQAHDRFNQEVHGLAADWQSNIRNPDYAKSMLGRIKGQLDQYYVTGRQLVYSSSPAGKFLLELNSSRGPEIAAGAYAALLDRSIPLPQPLRPKIFEGFLFATLYQRNIDWSGSANSQVLEDLRNKYQQNLDQQDLRFKDIESRNASLNSAYEKTLEEKTAALNKFQEEQTANFQKLSEDGKLTFKTVLKDWQNEMAAIQKTYDSQLALQSPVKYWKTKETYHNKQSVVFAWAASIAAILIAIGIGITVCEILWTVKANESPKPWQIGVFVIAAFFSIWIMRVLVRLLLSHLHLASDAAERRTMVLTYLSISRQGSKFDLEDKKLILQHLFRSASDGLVKDDAAPQTPMELLSRHN